MGKGLGFEACSWVRGQCLRVEVPGCCRIWDATLNPISCLGLRV